MYMTSAETAEVMNRLFDALAAGDRQGLLNVFAEDVEWHQPASVPDWDCRGRENVVERLGTGVVRDLFKRGTFRMNVQRLMIDGNVAISQQEASAVTLDGQDYRMEYCWIYTCQEGRIAHIREYLDTYVASQVFKW